ncbi:MAG: hypothetical protein JWM49_47 [Microbacteriaceae bacterium]|nr:hypothetical protein [Microbacteriaceae bacterium]
MAPDDDARESDFANESTAPGAQRRSTYRPPTVSDPLTQPSALAPETDQVDYDDDALATAIANENLRLGLTGAISIPAAIRSVQSAAPAAPAASTAPPARAALDPSPSDSAPAEVDPVPSDSATAESDPVPMVWAPPPPALTKDAPVEPAPPLAGATTAGESSLPATRRARREAERETAREGSRLARARRVMPASQTVPDAPDTTPSDRARSSEPSTPEVPLPPDFPPAPERPEPTPAPGTPTVPEVPLPPEPNEPEPNEPQPNEPQPPTAPSDPSGTYDDAGDQADGERASDGPAIYELVEPAPVSAAIPTVVPVEALEFEAPASEAPASEVTDGVEPIAVLDAAGIALLTGSHLVPAPHIGIGEHGPDDSVAADEPANLAAFVWMDGQATDQSMDTESSAQASPTAPVFPVKRSRFAPELSDLEPTSLDLRVGRAARLFWLWFAANSSVLSLAFGGALFSLGMSLRQAVIAALIGLAISFLPLGLGTLAGKRSGQPVMVVSRATFGLVGNVVPAVLALLTRVFWGGVLLWIVASATAGILVRSHLDGGLSERQLMVIALVVGFVLALVVAFFGYGLFARIQMILSVLAVVLTAGFIAVTWPSINLARALTVPDGPVILVLTGIVLVFSFVGLVWANSSADLARYQRPSSSGAASMLSASFGATLPAFVLIGYGAVLAASNPTIAAGLTNSPISTIAGLLPGWYPVPLIAATGLSLLSGVVLSTYSGAFALETIGVRVPRAWATVIVGALVFACAVALGFAAGNVELVFRDIATTIAVPVAAWAGILSAEMIIRRRRFDSPSLLRRGGVYPDVNWVNLSMLVAATAVGLGFTTASVAGLRWEGYLFSALGVPLGGDLAATDLGVLVALALGLLTPLVAGVPTVRAQERSPN